MEDKKQTDSKSDGGSNSKRTARFSEMLLQVTTDLAKTKSLDEALEVLVKITTSTIGAERGTIFLNDPATGNSIRELPKAISGGKSAFSTPRVSPVGHSPKTKGSSFTMPTKTSGSTRQWTCGPVFEPKAFFAPRCAR